ncbi:FAR1-related sequence 2 [Rhynchospora pubera]|uniref:Protein FAR1-RELATED SEQUENCE n=1 Tax=Rhynchospora pubera TaxID=906938 RepID=A0AAV8D0B9_9POAL|nr:FAR1-related sequence 2 [Rhynchospora pubera]
MSGSGIDLDLAWDIHLYSQGEQGCDDLIVGDDSGQDYEQSSDQNVDVKEQSMQVDQQVDDERFEAAVVIEKPLLPVVLAPYIGMHFPSNEVAHMYYLRFAFSRGFGVVKNGGSSKDGRKRVIYLCSRGGKPHSTCQSWYEFFGDVVTFDATYIVNRFDLPVAPIVGVNHHGQSIIFGCAMMTHEDTESYKWIISNWLDCMGGKAPKTIITDQSAAMKKAIAETLPDTRHRHCIWHILDKLDARIGNKEEAGEDIRRVIYESKTESEFENQWDSTISHYSLQARLRKRESDEDYECIRGQSRLISKFNPIEQQFSEVYTNKMFIKFQNEIKALIDSRFTYCERLGNTKVYTIDDRDKEFMVHFNCEDHTYTCECHLFETNGLVCRHALLVYKQENVAHVPAKYILDRWSKSFKRNYLNERAVAVSVRVRRETHKNLQVLLYPVFQKLLDYAVLDEDTQQSVVDGLNGLLISISKSKDRRTESDQICGVVITESGLHTHNDDGNENEDNSVKDPVKRCKRGQNPVNRKKSILEVKREQAKKKYSKKNKSSDLKSDKA